MKISGRIIGFSMRATVLVAVALFVISCGGKLQKADELDITEVPVQTVDGMNVVQTDKGKMQIRMEAERMERYKNDTLEWELFPRGIHVLAYNDEGLLETELKADMARHEKPVRENETWAAFGNVSVKNLINRETMETDTLYWDRMNERIYTDCYVKLYSPQGFMQGYGMESDQRARASVIMRPFNSYAVQQDSTVVVIDTVNFIGPLPKK